MSASLDGVDPALLHQLEEDRARRARLKLEILVSLRLAPKTEEPPMSSRARRMTSEMVLLNIREVGVNLEVDVRELPWREALKTRFIHYLAKRRDDRLVRERQLEEIGKMKETHEKLRGEMKVQEETIKTLRAKSRRMARLLQALQTRLVASTVVLQHQMNRKADLTQRLESIIYYRDSIMENAMAFYFGHHAIDPTVPLGGVFSPYAYIDYDEEEDRVENEREYLLTLTPASFKHSAQQRRTTLRILIGDSILETPSAFSYQSSSSTISSSSSSSSSSSFVPSSAPSSASIDYSTIAKIPFFSTNDVGSNAANGNHNNGNGGNGNSNNINGGGGGSSPRSQFNDDGFGGGFVSSPSMLDSSSSSAHGGAQTKRLIGKGLKPSMSDKPTRHEATQSPPKKSSGGIFSFFGTKNR